MRLIGTRWFSLSVPHSRQALYRPYIEPMNKEQEKTMRRLLLRKEPSLHPRIPADVNRILQLHSPSKDILKKRAATISWLNELIPTTFGKQFSVQDVSLSQYAQDLEYAPLELAIVDDRRKNGFPPGTEDEFRIGPYDPMNIVMLLQVHDLTGSLIDGDVFSLVPLVDQTLTVEELDPPLVYPSWSEPKFFSVPYIRYPVVVRAEETNELLSFHLSLPMPTLPPLIRLLQAYLCTDVYKTLVTFVYFWVRTIGLEQLSTTCVALMVIVFLQIKKGVCSLQNPVDQSVEELRKAATGVWVMAEFLPRFPPQSFFVETGFFNNKEIGNHVTEKQIKSYVYDFFEFWATHNPRSTVVASEQIFSVKAGKSITRLNATKKDAAARFQIQEGFAKIQRGLEAWSPLEPPITWCHQPIVIEDPFIPSFNHARTLSSHASRFFHNAAAVSHRTLHHGHSVHNILGHALSHNKRQYSTATLSQQIRDSYRNLAPSPQVFNRRKLTISRIEKVIKKEFGNQFYLLNFGSTRYRVSVANSDLDLVIMDPGHPVGLIPQTTPSRLPRIYSVRNVGQALASYRFTVYIIPTASVPIVKCRDPTTGIDCDININDRLGLINTYLVDNYCKIAPNIRPMCVAIKRWAKHCNMNDSSGAFGPRTFSSYALVLMVIGYLQMGGILPNLQEGFPPLPSNPREGIFYINRKKKATLCDTRFRSIDRNTIQVEFDLGEALLGWFNFWGNEFDYVSQLLSIRDGGLIERHFSDQDRLNKEPQTKNKGKEKAESTIDENQDDELPGDAEDDVIAAWHEQREELRDDITEGLSAELNELEDENIVDASETAMTSSISPEDSEELTQFEVKTWDGVFVVVDPFDRAKNLTSHFSLPLLKQFQFECRSAVELIKSGGTLDDLIPVDQAGSDNEDNDGDSQMRTEKKKKKPRPGIPIKARGAPKDIDMTDNSQSRPEIRKPKKNVPKRNGHPVTPVGNSVRPQEPPQAGPSTLSF